MNRKGALSAHPAHKPQLTNPPLQSATGPDIVPHAMSSPEQATIPDPEAPQTTVRPLSEIGRIVGVFASPKQAFQDIVQRPRWYVPVILLVLASLCLITLYAQHVGFARLIQESLDQNPRTQSMTPEQRNQAFQMGMTFGKTMAYVSAIAAPPISILVIAGVLMLITNTMLGSQISYGQMSAIAAYSLLTGLVSIALSIAVMFLRSPEDFDLRNPLAFNLGAAFSPDSTSKWLLSLASSLDLFSFWTMALLATGITVASRKLSWSKAFVAVLVPWAVLVLVKASWAAIFS